MCLIHYNEGTNIWGFFDKKSQPLFLMKNKMNENNFPDGQQGYLTRNTTSECEHYRQNE